MFKFMCIHNITVFGFICRCITISISMILIPRVSKWLTLNGIEVRYVFGLYLSTGLNFNISYYVHIYIYVRIII